MRKVKKVTVFDIQWNQKYRILKIFKNEFGHCNVPDKTFYKGCELGRWVVRQRTRKNKLPIDRISKLDNIGFVWDIFEYTWEKHFEELLDYQKKFKHCKVSKGHNGYLALANWIIKQRQNFKQGKLSNEKYNKLDELGFVWEEYRCIPWNENLKKLKNYKLKYGDCNVTKSFQDVSLANWVSIQRRDKLKLSQNQIEQLNELDFRWKGRK